jgi:hypothetical protein
MLRNVLRWQAMRWALVGIALVVAPGTFTERWLSQSDVGDAAWLRALGVASIVLAAQMVLVARRLEDLWWWSWSFAILEVGIAIVAVAHIVAVAPADGAAWPWWVTAALAIAFVTLDVAALARAGTERSPV